MEPCKEIRLPYTRNEAEHTIPRLFLAPPPKKKKKDSKSNWASRFNYLFLGNKGDGGPKLNDYKRRQSAKSRLWDVLLANWPTISNESRDVKTRGV